MNINKEFLRTFVDSLNRVNVGIDNMFPREAALKEIGGFELNIQEFVLDGDTETKSVKIWLYYKERNKRLNVYHKDFRIPINIWTQVSEDAFFTSAYFDILNHLLFSIDCVGKLKLADDDSRIDVLTIQTILKEGLNQIP